MDAAPTRLVLVRHGQTDSNAAGRFQGHQDIPLNRVGRSQAEAMASRVAALRPARIVASDLGRAQQTARAVAAASGVEVTTDPRLREIDVGTWSGRTIAEIAAAHPWFHDKLAAGEDFRRSDDGETATEAGERVAGVLAELAHAHPGETTVVVGHGLSLRVGLALATGLGFAGSFALAGLWNCSWTIVEPGDRWRIVTYNAVASSRES
ncbi:histidine phosphatase family protein [Propioniciclava soli]|uniref:histidine phosphatase family protein n=1 Tax=Propioniciclava soli TaxID=2775081 RepID=UPI001E2E2323